MDFEQPVCMEVVELLDGGPGALGNVQKVPTRAVHNVPEQLAAVEALLRKINLNAELMRTSHSRVEPSLLLGKARFSLQQAEEHPDWLCVAPHAPSRVLALAARVALTWPP